MTKTLALLGLSMMLGQHAKPWKFECDAARCPSIMHVGSSVGINPVDGNFQECHAGGECRTIPGQKPPACTATKGRTWYESCVSGAAPAKAQPTFVPDADAYSTAKSYILTTSGDAHGCAWGFRYDEGKAACSVSVLFSSMTATVTCSPIVRDGRDQMMICWYVPAKEESK